MNFSSAIEPFHGPLRVLAVSSLGLLVIALLFLVSLAIYNIFFHPLHSYPGPKLWAASRLPWAYHNALGNLSGKILEFHEKYGHCVRLAPNELSYTATQGWKDIYAHRQGQPEMPKDPLRVDHPPNGIMSIIGSNREDHSRYRRLLSHAFSEKGMREQEPSIKEYVDLLIDRLDEAAKTHMAQDMVAWYNRTTFDVIGDLAFGESFHCLRDRATHDWISALGHNIHHITLANLMRRFGLSFLIPHVLPKEILAGRRKNFEYTEAKIDARIRYGAERGDFWDKIMIKSKDENADKQGMSRGEMQSNASVLVIAGSETTATLLSGATYLLLKNPDKLQKATEEIRTSYKSSDDISLLNVKNLKYLLAVLDESARMYPPVPFQPARVVPGGGAMINGKFVPEGVSVNMHHTAAYHLPANFHRPNDFLPERWLEEHDPVFDSDEKAVMQPFAVGPRNCIGMNLAYSEMRLIMAKVLWNFDLSLDETKMMQQDGTEDWLDQRAFTLWKKPPLWIVLTPRKSWAHPAENHV